MPGARTPSSLVTRMRKGFLRERRHDGRRCRLRQLPYRCPFPDGTAVTVGAGGGRARHPHAITIDRLEAPHACSTDDGRLARRRAARHRPRTSAGGGHRGRGHAALVHGRRCARHRRLRRHRHVQRRSGPGAGPVAQPSGRRPLLDRRSHRAAPPGTNRRRRNAIHGLVRWLPWRLRSRAQNVVVLGCTLFAQPGYPWRLEFVLEYRLGREGWSSPPGSPTPTRCRRPSVSDSIPTSPSARPPIDAVRLTLPGQRCLVTDDTGPAHRRHHRGRQRARLHLRVVGSGRPNSTPPSPISGP